MKRKSILVLSFAMLLASCGSTSPSGGSSSASSSKVDTSELDSSLSQEASSSGALSTDNEDLAPLYNAINKMGLNYTAQVIYGKEVTYQHLCTEDAIYKDYFSEWASSGFVFKEGLAYFFEYKDGTPIIDQEAYTFSNGEAYTKDYVVKRDYQISALNPTYFHKVDEFTYACNKEYLYQTSRALIYENEPQEILINLSSDKYIYSININNFYDSDSGDLDSVEIKFVDVGTTIVNLEGSEDKPLPPQMPDPTDPNKPVAPSSLPTGIKPVDEVDPAKYVNGANDEDNLELKNAIDEARANIYYLIQDYFDDTYQKDKDATKAEETSLYYIGAYNGNKAYVASCGDDVNPNLENYFVQSEGQVYRVYEEKDAGFSYDTRTGTFDEKTLGGNIFNYLNASMFTLQSDGSYKIKSSYVSSIGAKMFSIARGASSIKTSDGYSVYSGNPYPTRKFNDISIKLSEGHVSSVVASGAFTFNDGSIDDIQKVIYTCDTSFELKMPYEKQIEYTQDEQALKSAIEAIGNNYTVDYLYYDTTHITEYYGDRAIYKDYGSDWASSGFVYINDYAYFFEFENKKALIDETPYKPYINDDFMYYRAWMNKYYLPFAQIDVKDFTKDGDEYVLNSAKFRQYEKLFIDLEGKTLSFKISLEEGKVSKITSTSYDDTGTLIVESTATVSNVGTTEFLF